MYVKQARKSNTEHICKKITSGISTFRRLKEFVDRQTLVSVYDAIAKLKKANTFFPFEQKSLNNVIYLTNYPSIHLYNLEKRSRHFSTKDLRPF